MAEVRTCLLKRADKYQALIGPIKPPLEGAVMIGFLVGAKGRTDYECIYLFLCK